MSRDDLRNMAAMMARRAQLASVLLLGYVSLAMAADKAAEQLNELGDDFLEYLGSLEGVDESWMDFAATAGKDVAKQQTGTGKPVSASSSSASSQSKPMPQAASANTSAASKTGKVEK